MSKAVSISEGGKGRIFPQTDKLKVNNVGGGNSLWLPEDEVVTGTLYADENGIYLAENDGFSCYDTVVVRVEDETDPDDPDWELDPDELDEDVWDEESLEEFQEDPEAFEEKFNDKEKWKAEKAKKEKSQKIKKVKSLKPSKITGIDPVDGNPYQVGVDSEGNLTKEMLPSSIHIVVPPWKREYENGEEINFYGMHVYLLDKDGHPFKTEKYPTGEIPFEELLLPVTIAEGDGKTERKDFYDITCNCASGDYIKNEAKTDTYSGYESWLAIEGEGPFYIVGFLYHSSSTDYTGGYIVSPKEFTYLFTAVQNGHERANRTDTADTYTVSRGGKTYTLASTGRLSYQTDFNPTTNAPLNDITDGSKREDYFLAAIYGEQSEESGNIIPVQWMRSDGEMLEDKFGISISTIDDTWHLGNSTNPVNNNESGHTSGGF